MTISDRPKVFCIGFHKTGTTSLAEALEIVGYRVTGPNGVHDRNISRNALTLAKRLVPKYDAFQDNPWPVIFRDLDAMYPGSRFILTIRDTDAWLRSQVRHFGTQTTPMRDWIYGAGCPSGNETIYRERYETHNSDVLEHFAHREQDLLVMRLEEGDGWQQLAPFLGVDTPAAKFPHANSAGSRESQPKNGRLRRIFARVR